MQRRTADWRCHLRRIIDFVVGMFDFANEAHQECRTKFRPADRTWMWLDRGRRSSKCAVPALRFKKTPE